MLSFLPIKNLLPNLISITLTNLDLQELTGKGKQYIEAVREASKKLKMIVFQSKEQTIRKQHSKINALVKNYRKQFNTLQWEIKYNATLQNMHILTFRTIFQNEVERMSKIDISQIDDTQWFKMRNFDNIQTVGYICDDSTVAIGHIIETDSTANKTNKKKK
eukprot:400503_1